jgi:endonuclease YncB( thermonuclease family)
MSRKRIVRRSPFGFRRGRVGLGALLLIAIVWSIAPLIRQKTFTPPPADPGPQMSGGPTLTGRARVIDGDTIELSGTRIRIFGIDAPEKHQFCQDGTGNRYGCGMRALNALEGRIDGQTLVCEKRDTDRYGRSVAVCRQGDADVGAWMVESGWAVAYRRYGGDYAAAEDRARGRRAGIWAGSFENPADWRRNHPR